MLNEDKGIRFNALNLQYFLLVSSGNFNVDSGKGDTHTGVGDTSPEADITPTNVDSSYINAVGQKRKHNPGK